MQLSALMKAGVNIGNTFEAVIVGEDGSLSGDETCWGNPTPNKACLLYTSSLQGVSHSTIKIGYFSGGNLFSGIPFC